MQPGFANPVHDAQRTFRAVLEAMSRPGRVVDLELALVPPAPLHQAAGALCLTLVDLDTPLWLDAAAAPAASYLGFHCGAPIVAEPAAARFALVADPATLPPLAAFDPGRDDAPDRSATLIVQVEDLRPGRGVRLVGPGIDGAVRLEVLGVPDRLFGERAALASFPRGLDMVFTAGRRLAALPRTTRVEA